MIRKHCIVWIYCLMVIAEAKLLPIPFVTEPHEIQRLGWQECEDIWNYTPFTEVYGVSAINLRSVPRRDLIVFTDPAASMLVYCVRDGSEIQWLKTFPDNWPGDTHFRYPKGICIDTAIYYDNQNLTFIYVVDDGNNRIVRLKYDAENEFLTSHDDFAENYIYKARGIACVAVPNGGSYVVVADAGNHRIVIWKFEPDGNFNLCTTYGSFGGGVGQFNFPQGVSISQIPS